MTTTDRTKKTREYTYPALNMGPNLKEMNKALNDLDKKDIINRIWHKDSTVWKANGNEIRNRLGWLNINETLAEKIYDLNDFADEIKAAGFHHCVLLGMGGSSLGQEVFRQTFGSAAGYPPLIVLDSTVPAQIRAVARSIEPRHTFFLVSSKSGTTVETKALYRYFRGLVEKEIGRKKAGRNFAAITDLQTPLSRVAHDEGFRHTFLNPADIGGRYSVLSYFGLVPAALIGMDLNKLLESATRMQEGCAPCVDIHENAGAWLGALISSCALQGRDKLTFVISPAIRSFGLWVEQLLAESLAKQGKGIIPIIDEPLSDPKNYCADRLFIYLRLNGDNNRDTDEAVMKLEVGGQPIIQIQLGDQSELGAEFFRWEFATAVAGAILGVNPFDQPDVQATKEAARQVLEQQPGGKIASEIKSAGNPGALLSQIEPGSYLAILAFIKPTAATDKAFAAFRKKVVEKYHIATTLGYGPRFLHSTGQLHKGGPNSGLFLQITAGSEARSLRVPDEAFTLGELTGAEATGDYRALEDKGRKVTQMILGKVNGKALREALSG